MKRQLFKTLIAGVLALALFIGLVPVTVRAVEANALWDHVNIRYHEYPPPWLPGAPLDESTGRHIFGDTAVLDRSAVSGTSDFHPNVFNLQFMSPVISYLDSLTVDSVTRTFLHMYIGHKAEGATSFNYTDGYRAMTGPGTPEYLNVWGYFDDSVFVPVMTMNPAVDPVGGFARFPIPAWADSAFLAAQNIYLWGSLEAEGWQNRVAATPVEPVYHWPVPSYVTAYPRHAADLVVIGFTEGRSLTIHIVENFDDPIIVSAVVDAGHREHTFPQDPTQGDDDTFEVDIALVGVLDDLDSMSDVAILEWFEESLDDDLPEWLDVAEIDWDEPNGVLTVTFTVTEANPGLRRQHTVEIEEVGGGGDAELRRIVFTQYGLSLNDILGNGPSGPFVIEADEAISNDVPAAVVITVSDGATLTVGGTVEVAGEITVADGGSLEVDGTLVVDGGEITVEGDLVVDSAGTLTVADGDVIVDTGGELTIEGSVTVDYDGTLDNRGDIIVDSSGNTLVIEGELINTGTITVTARGRVDGTGTVDNTGGTIRVYLPGQWNLPEPAGYFEVIPAAIPQTGLPGVTGFAVAGFGFMMAAGALWFAVLRRKVSKQEN